MKGMIITMAAGGAWRDRRARRLTKDAKSDTGRWLGKMWLAISCCTGIQGDSRRAQKKFCHAKKPRPVLEMQNIPVKECVQPSVEGWIIATCWTASGYDRARTERKTHRLYSFMRMNRAFSASRPTVPPVLYHQTSHDDRRAHERPTVIDTRRHPIHDQNWSRQMWHNPSVHHIQRARHQVFGSLCNPSGKERKQRQPCSSKDCSVGR